MVSTEDALEHVTGSVAAIELKDNKEGAPAPPASSKKEKEDKKNDEEDDEGGEDGEDDDGEGEGADADAGEGGAGSSKNKKKKKKNKKKKKSGPKQTEPPRTGLSKLFPNSIYPAGEIVDYVDDNAYRTTSEEKRAIERTLNESDPRSPYNYNAIRRAAETHRQVRHFAQRHIKPGQSMIEIAESIEDSVRALSEADGLEGGMGFPTGLSVNNCAAHYNPNPGDDNVLKASDVMKVDIGVHVNGRIVDSAFTMVFEPTYQTLLDAVKDATNTGIREAGIDARLGEIGGAIQETMESYEVEVDGKVLPVKPIRNLNGHDIHVYKIHGGKSVPLVNNGDQTKMEEGEYFAIETFGSTGRGHVDDYGDCSHFAKNGNAVPRQFRLNSAKTLLGSINKHFGTLPFCRRYLERVGETKHLLALRNLVDNDIVTAYPPLYDIPGSMTAQYEHTILLRPTCKEIVSRGDDY